MLLFGVNQGFELMREALTCDKPRHCYPQSQEQCHPVNQVASLYFKKPQQLVHSIVLFVYGQTLFVPRIAPGGTVRQDLENTLQICAEIITQKAKHRVKPVVRWIIPGHAADLIFVILTIIYEPAIWGYPLAERERGGNCPERQGKCARIVPRFAARLALRIGT